MKEQIICQGPLSEVCDQIVQMRAEARAQHGWIMDIYILRKSLERRGGRTAHPCP
jgi:precorrin-6A synthase